MELLLDDLAKIKLRDDYEFVSACTSGHISAVLYRKQLRSSYYAYRMEAYDTKMNCIAAAELEKNIAYDTIRIYKNICLLIDTKGSYEKDRFEKNALLMTMQSIILKEFPIGIGINSVSISPQGTIWCGYGNQGKYQEYVRKKQKGSSRIIAAWNFFGELVYELDYPDYDETFGFLSDCNAIYAKDNDEIYFFYYDRYDLCCLKHMKALQLTPFACDHKRPFQFTIYKQQLLVYFEPYVEEFRSLELYHFDQHTLSHQAAVHIKRDGQAITDYLVFMNEDTILIQEHGYIYRYVLKHD